MLPIAGGTSCNRSEPENPLPPQTVTFLDSDQRSPITTQTISEFKVWAETDNWIPVMKDVTVRRTGLNSWSYSPVVEWPEEPLSFYAVSPASFSLQDVYRAFTVYYKCTGDVDLLVAVRKDVRQTDGRIKLNFCHTLARITASIASPLEDRVVEVRRISIADVGEAGTFHVPDRTTVLNQPLDDISDCWEIWNMNATDFALYDGGESPIRLSAYPYTPRNGNEFMLPVRLSALEYTGYIHGSAMRVTYRLIDKKSGEVIWPTSATPAHLRPAGEQSWGLANIPLKPATPGGRWLAGREYHYNITINGEPTFPPSTRTDVSAPVGISITCTSTPY